MHGSAENLPKGRGRSPMNWSILEGRTSFITNLFRYDAGVDSGDVIGTIPFEITGADTAETCHFKNTMAMRCLIKKHLPELQKGILKTNKQLDNTPTYYPKRTPEDGLINWNRTSHEVQRFIRAVGRPFAGAFSFLKDRQVRIWRAEIFDSQFFDHENKPNGLIVEQFDSGKFIVKMKDALLIVHEYEGEVTVGESFHNSDKVLRNFPTNSKGFHDLEEAELTKWELQESSET